MGSLKVGDTVKMKYGGEAKVLAEFGSGGQGTVYKVSYNGKEYALKWYHTDVFKGKEKAFYNNLENNIQKGAPTKDFLWPLGITEVHGGVFGYIMDVRPAGYYELTEFFVGSKKKKQVRFKSFNAIADAAINIVQAFRELHNSGYSYQDINNGNFFINPENGKVLICDNDNVSPFGVNLGILGKQRYMAPEVVIGGDPDKQSDRFSLAVILFRLLFINHPLEGKYSTPPCMTKELERRYYGTSPIFVYDPTNDRNRPVPGTDNNLKMFWPVYPEYIRELARKQTEYGSTFIDCCASRRTASLAVVFTMRMTASITPISFAEVAVWKPVRTSSRMSPKKSSTKRRPRSRIVFRCS